MKEEQTDSHVAEEVTLLSVFGLTIVPFSFKPCMLFRFCSLYLS